MKTYLFSLGLLLGSTLVLTGCPSKMDPGQSSETGYKKVNHVWGIPVIHAITAGFNGVPSEPNFTGPANTASHAEPTK